MKNPEQKSVLRRFFQSRLFLIVTSLALVFITFSYARAYYQEYQVRQKIKELEAQVQSLEGKKLESLKILEYVTSNNFIEAKARTELNLKKPGEKVVFIDDLTNLTTSTSTIVAVDEKRLSNPLKWWYYFSRR